MAACDASAAFPEAAPPSQPPPAPTLKILLTATPDAKPTAPPINAPCHQDNPPSKLPQSPSWVHSVASQILVLPFPPLPHLVVQVLWAFNVSEDAGCQNWKPGG